MEKQITILQGGGYLDYARNQPDKTEQGKEIKSMMGVSEEKEKLVINETGLNENEKIVFNMMHQFRQTEVKTKSVKSDERNHNSDDELKAMLRL